MICCKGLNIPYIQNMENSYYVYIHIRKDSGKVFYVGKGKGRRAFWKSQRNKHWQFVANKSGYDVYFIEQNLNEQEAFNLEKTTIAYYGKSNLTNYTDGGDGASGFIKTSEFKELMRKKMLGRVFSSETIQKMREAAKLRGPDFQEKRAKKLRGRKHTKEHREKLSKAGMGRIVSDETRAKISAHHKGKKKNPEAVVKMAASKSKPVFCHNNEIVYGSMSEAARKLGLKQSHISNVCNGLANHTKGFVFSRA